MNSNEIFDCIIIGGGISGLSSAYYQQKTSKNIAIVDPGHLGGVIKTSKREGFNCECGPNVVLLKPFLLQLVRDLDFENQIVYPRVSNYKQMVFKGGKAQVVPKTPLAFLTSSLLTISEKVSLLIKLFKKDIFQKKVDDLSVEEFFTQIIGKKLTSEVLDPVLQGIYGGDIKKLSARSIFPVLFSNLMQGKSVIQCLKSNSGNAKPQIAVFRDGMEDLISHLLNEVTTNAKIFRSEVLQVVKNADYYEVTLLDNSKILSRNVTIATSGKHTATYLQNLDSNLSARLSDLKYSSLVVVHAHTNKLPENFNDSFGVLLPSTMNSAFLGVMFNSRLFAHLAPAGQELLTVCLGGIHHPEVLEMSEDAIVEFSKSALREHLNIENIHSLKVTKWEKVIPQYEVNHYQLIEQIRQCELKNPGLKFVGADIGGVGVPDRVAAAKSAQAAGL